MKKRKNKGIYFLIETELYGELIHVFVNCTAKEANDGLNRMYPKIGGKPFEFEEDEDTVTGAIAEFTNDKETKRHFALWLNSDKDIDTIVHETHHLTNRIILDKDIEISMENDEPSAYFQAYLVTKILEGIKEERKKCQK